MKIGDLVRVNKNCDASVMGVGLVIGKGTANEDPKSSVILTLYFSESQQIIKLAEYLVEKHP